MQLIIHEIRLLEAGNAAAFEHWVQETDYAACPDLPSVQAFSVQKAAPGSGCDYFEIITVSSQQDFERDMESAVFARLVEGFSAMAEVVRELPGTRVGTGYRRDS